MSLAMLEALAGIFGGAVVFRIGRVGRCRRVAMRTARARRRS